MRKRKNQLTRCPLCGKPFVHSHRVYCNNAHKQKFYRLNKVLRRNKL